MVCCFANPSSAPARMPPFQPECHSDRPSVAAIFRVKVPQARTAARAGFHRSTRVTSRTLSNPSRRRRLRRERYAFVSSARHFVPMRAEPMKISRSECGDPVFRPIRLRCSGFRSLTWPAPPTSQEGRLVRSRWRGIVSGRFRVRKLVGSGGYSKCFFAAVFPQAMLAGHALAACGFIARSARGTP